MSLHQPSERHQHGKSGGSEWWLQPPFLHRERLRGHVDVLRDAESKASVHLSPHLPTKQNSASDRPSQPPMRERSGFRRSVSDMRGGQATRRVQRVFSMPQIEVTTRRGESEAASPKPCEKKAQQQLSATRTRTKSRRAKSGGAPPSCSPTPAGQQRRQDSHPAVAAQLAGRISWGTEELTDEF